VKVLLLIYLLIILCFAYSICISIYTLCPIYLSADLFTKIIYALLILLNYHTNICSLYSQCVCVCIHIFFSLPTHVYSIRLLTVCTCTIFYPHIFYESWRTKGLQYSDYYSSNTFYYCSNMHLV
jgi:hypothetical protein